jgi:hypothetical protein
MNRSRRPSPACLRTTSGSRNRYRSGSTRLRRVNSSKRKRWTRASSGCLTVEAHPRRLAAMRPRGIVRRRTVEFSPSVVSRVRSSTVACAINTRSKDLMDRWQCLNTRDVFRPQAQRCGGQLFQRIQHQVRGSPTPQGTLHALERDLPTRPRSDSSRRAPWLRALPRTAMPNGMQPAERRSCRAGIRSQIGHKEAIKINGIVPSGRKFDAIPHSIKSNLAQPRAGSARCEFALDFFRDRFDDELFHRCSPQGC